MNDTVSNAIERLRSGLPEGTELVAVSKFQPIEALREAYDAGQRVFGESRVNELLEKAANMPDDVKWHFIGHLQTNKVKGLMGRVALIESVDTQKLLDEIDRQSEKAHVTTRVLMQVHVAAEETKFGWSADELLTYFRERRFESLKASHLCGLMGMATNTDDEVRIASDFARISELRTSILKTAPDLRGFDILSMGMSGDYKIALRYGSTHVRIGTDIFGARR